MSAAVEGKSTLWIDPRYGAFIVHASRDAAPAEACGLLVGRRVGAHVVVLDVPSARNVAAAPERAFVLDPGEVIALHDAAARAGLSVVGTWHSHVRGPAVPSRADLEQAWPGHVLVIASGEALRAFVVERGSARELELIPLEARRPAAPGDNPT